MNMINNTIMTTKLYITEDLTLYQGALTTNNKNAVGLMAQLMKLCQQHLSCLRRCLCFSS